MGSFLFGLGSRLKDSKDDQGPITILVFLTLFMAVAVYQIWERFDGWFPPLKQICKDHSRFIDELQKNGTKLGVYIAMAAGLGMFAELVIIRMQADFFQLFAHFKNISLLSCFISIFSNC